MTHKLPGNPWVDYFIHNTRQASAALRNNHFEGSERLSQEALGTAVLALAYEQRTANLIAAADLTMHGGLNPDYDMETIYNRLGLGDNND